MWLLVIQIHTAPCSAFLPSVLKPPPCIASLPPQQINDPLPTNGSGLSNALKVSMASNASDVDTFWGVMLLRYSRSFFKSRFCWTFNTPRTLNLRNIGKGKVTLQFEASTQALAFFHRHRLSCSGGLNMICLVPA